MDKNINSPVWVEIDFRNLAHNIRELSRKANSTPIMGVVKADAYGHGMIQTVKAMKKCGIETFAVAKLTEAIEFRQVYKEEELIIFTLTDDIFAGKIVEYDITPVICEYRNAKAISDEAVKAGKTVQCYIAVDTGMGRVGYLPWDENAVSDIRKISELPNMKIKALLSHMSVADETDKSYSRRQGMLYNEFYDRLTAAGIDIPVRTMANSPTVLDLPEYCFDLVRPGISVYGYYPSIHVRTDQLDLRPVMSLKGIISYLKDVPEGFYVSYGRNFKSERPSKIATVAIGYADGFPREYSPNAKAIVNGVVCKIAGNICMDQCMIDVTDVPDVKAGDEVIFMGSDGKNNIPCEYIAGCTNTINQEVCCRLGQRLPKVYIW